MNIILRRVKAFLLSLSLVASIAQPASAFAAEPIYVTVDGSEVSFETPPQIINDRVVLQIRAIVEMLGCGIVWDEATQTVYINQSAVPLQQTAIKGDNINVYVNNEIINFPDQKPVIYDNYVLIPSRAVVEKLGCSIEWIADAQTQVITSPGKAAIQSQQTPVPTIEMAVYVTDSGSKYHASGCRYLSESKIEISLDKAKAQGYTACSVCNPPR